MKAVSRSTLKITIYNIINPTISVHRESRGNEFYNDYYPNVTKTELIDFIESNPYFDKSLKEFLGNKSILNVDGMIISDAWRSEFMDKVYKWAESFEWLYDDVSCIRDPYLSTIKMSTEPLGLCSIKR